MEGKYVELLENSTALELSMTLSVVNSKINWKKGHILRIEKGPFRFHQYTDQKIEIMDLVTRNTYVVDSKIFFSSVKYCPKNQQVMLKKLYG